MATLKDIAGASYAADDILREAAVRVAADSIGRMDGTGPDAMEILLRACGHIARTILVTCHHPKNGYTTCLPCAEAINRMAKE